MMSSRYQVPAALLMGLAVLAIAQNIAYAQIPCEYDVEIIQAPTCGITGPPVTVALGISPNGKYVVGRWDQCDTGYDEAFCYDTETKEFVTLPRPAGVYQASASDVNDNGWIVGTYHITNVGARGFVYKMIENEWIELPPEGKTGGSSATAVNNAGQVCGSRSLKGANPDGGSPFNAFIWSETEGFTDLGVMNGPNSEAMDINENGDVCGWTGRGIARSGDRGFLFEGGKVSILPPVSDGVSSLATSIGLDGSLVGYGRIPSTHSPGHVTHAFVFRNNEMLDLGTLPEYLRSFANSITPKHSVVGSCRTLKDGSDSMRAFVWDATSMHAIDDLIRSESGISTVLIAWNAIVSGILVGEGVDDRGDVVGIVLSGSM